MLAAHGWADVEELMNQDDWQYDEDSDQSMPFEEDPDEPYGTIWIM